MPYKIFRYFFLFLFFFFQSFFTRAQTSYTPARNISFKMPGELGIREDSLQKEFMAKGWDGL